MKYKIIENEMPEFEEQLNEFTSKEEIEVVNIAYSATGVSGDEGAGWLPCVMHNALISYVERK